MGSRFKNIFILVLVGVFAPGAQAAYWQSPLTCTSKAKKTVKNSSKNSLKTKPRKKPKPKPDLATTLQKEEDLSRFAKLVETAQLVDLLKIDANFTLFAPTNAALSALPAGYLEHLQLPTSKAELAQFVNYHMLGKKFTVKKLETAPESASLKEGIKTVAGKNITIKVTDHKLFVNGARIVKTIPTSNGILHIIDEALRPPVV